jgi:outer membrane autotransporter protein
MKSFVPFRVPALALCLALALAISLPVAALAQNITFPGNGVLQTAPGGLGADSLFPGTSLSGNKVTINSGTIPGSVFGGVTAGNGNVTNNTVIINGGAVNGSVYGGYSGNDNATNNTVTISGSPQFSPGPGGHTGLYGGGGGGDAFTGNTLNVWNYSGSAVRSVQNFQYFNFILPASLQGGLEVTGDVVFGSSPAPGAKPSTVTGVSIMGGGSAPPVGAKIALIKANDIQGPPIDTSIAGQKGATLDYLWNLDATGGLYATVAQVNANPQTKALSEAALAGVALLNQTGDLASYATKAAAAATSTAPNVVDKTPPDGTKDISEALDDLKIRAFGVLSGGSSRHNTGSHVNVSGVSLITGLALGANLPPGRLTLGAFFEYGSGSYDTYNSFSNAASVHGNGNMYHYGGGILGRMDFVDTGPGNFYAETSFRMGGIHNEYNTSALRDAMGNSAKGYDSFSPYYGIHAGLGYVWKFTEKVSFDLYGKYFWTRQQGAKVTLATGDPVKFEDVDSHRLRLGGRVAYAINDYVTPYIGAAWEHEFDGRQKATTYGYAINAPSLRGDTGMGELGLTLKPFKDLPLSFDLGVQGYVGKREGVTGSLQVRFEF